MVKSRIAGGSHAAGGRLRRIYGRDRGRKLSPGWQQSEPFAVQQLRRAHRWMARAKAHNGLPPRHIAAVLGWKYVRQDNGQVLHVPHDVR